MAEGYDRRFPAGTRRITTGCQYCAVGCGYNAFLVPLEAAGGGEETLAGVSRFITPAMTGTVRYRGETYRAAVAPDARCDLNKGNHSVRGGSQGDNLVTADGSGRSTTDRLKSPQVRLADGSWADLAWDDLYRVMAELIARATGMEVVSPGDTEDGEAGEGEARIRVASPQGLGAKMFEYQYLENTFAGTKLLFSAIGTPNFAYHDRPSGAGSSPGMKDAGLRPHDFSYEEVRQADLLVFIGTNPYENQSVFFMQHCVGKEMIVIDPRRTATADYALRTGGLHLQPTRLGADPVLLYAMARRILERWDEEHPGRPFPLRDGIPRDRTALEAVKAELLDDLGNRAATDGEKSDLARRLSRAADFKTFSDDFLRLGDEESPYTLERAATLTDMKAEEIDAAVTRMISPTREGKLPKVALFYEKGLIWGFNYHNTSAVASLGLLLGAYSEPGRLVGRVGGHQKGWAASKANLSSIFESSAKDYESEPNPDQKEIDYSEGYPLRNATDTYGDQALGGDRIPVRHNLDNHLFGPPPADVATQEDSWVELRNGLRTRAEPDVRLLWIIGGNYLGQTHDGGRKRRVLEQRLQVADPADPADRTEIQRPATADPEAIIASLGARIEAGGVVAVHQDILPNPTTELCDLVIPAAGWGEDSFCRYNAQRRLKLYEGFQDLPLHAVDAERVQGDPLEQLDELQHSPKPDWIIFRDIARALGRWADGRADPEDRRFQAALEEAFNWRSASEVADAMARESHRRGMLGDLLALAEDGGVAAERGQVHTVLGKGGGGESRLLTGRYRIQDDPDNPVHGNGIATNGVLLPVRWNEAERVLLGRLRNPPSGPFFFVQAGWEEIEEDFRRINLRSGDPDEVFVTNGRFNHLWNNMFHHLRNDYINQRYPEDLPGTVLEVNREWAAERQIQNGQVVRATAGAQSFLAIASLQDSVPRQGAFALFSYPVRHEGRFTFRGYVNNTTDGYADGINPIAALKYGRAVVRKEPHPTTGEEDWIYRSSTRIGPTYEARNSIGPPESLTEPGERMEEDGRRDWEMRELIVTKGLPRAQLHPRVKHLFLDPDRFLGELKNTLLSSFAGWLPAMRYPLAGEPPGRLIDSWYGAELEQAQEWIRHQTQPQNDDDNQGGGQSGMSRFDKVKEILDRSVGGADAPVGVHGAFWRGKTRDQFITEPVFGHQLVIVGNGAASNLVKALRGESPFGSDLGTPGSSFRRMPGGMDPVPEADIGFVEKWIDDGCPDVEEGDEEAENGDAEAGVGDLKEIRILPSLAIARLGSSPQPMDNYDTPGPGADDPAGFRPLRPAETLRVEGGRVTGANTPDAVRFRDGEGRIRPVCPFLEVWARFDDGPLEPLTQEHLSRLGGSPQSVRWTVRVANLKAFRRTGAVGDRITANVAGFDNHTLKPLRGRAPNFRSDRTIPMGAVQYLEPTEEFPEIRLRFTPGRGLVYGHRQDFPQLQVVYDPARGQWDNHEDNRPPTNSPTPRARAATAPANIYARDQNPGPNRGRNLGYLDDTCDGIVEVEVALDDKTLGAKARISSGPPDFAPDSYHVRTVADDLEQMALGPAIDDETVAEELDELTDKVIDIVARALETMRLSDTANLNRLYGSPFAANRGAYPTARDTHAGLRRSVEGLRAAAGSPEREAAVNQLRRIVTFLRSYEAAADFSTAGTRRMPALMRGADAGHLALTRRQRNLVEKAIEVLGEANAGTPEAAMLRLVQVLGPNVASLHDAFRLNEGLSLGERFADPPQTLAYLREAGAQGFLASQLGLTGQPLVVPGQPDDSAFIQLITNPQHPMNGPFSNYVDQDSGANGVEVTRNWIESLAPGPAPIT